MLIRFSFLSLVFVFLSMVVFSQPKIHVVGGSTADFGQVFTGSSPVKVLTVKNTGTQTLQIKGIIATCECAKAEISSKTIAPGKSAKLKLTLATASLVGPLEKRINIQSNDPVHFAFLLDVKAEVRTLLTWDPQRVYFSLEDETKGTSTRIVLFNTSDTTVEILKVKDLNSFVDIKFTHVALLPRDTTSIQISPKPLGGRNVQGVIRVTTDQKLQPNILIRYYIQGLKGG